MKVSGFVRGSHFHFLLFHDSFIDHIDRSSSHALIFLEDGSCIRLKLTRTEINQQYHNINPNKSQFGYCNTSLLVCDIPSRSTYLGGQDIIKKVVVEVDEERLEYVSTAYSLDSTFFDSFDSFHKNFSFASGRHVDPETVLFVADNNLSADDCKCPTVWVTSFSIFCYKNIQLFENKKPKIDAFFEKARSVCSLVSNEERKHNSLRVDYTSRLISISTAFLHYLVSVGEFEKSKNVIDTIFSEIVIDETAKYHYNFIRLIAFDIALAPKPENPVFYENLIRRVILKGNSSTLEKLPPVYLKEFSETLSIASVLLRNLGKVLPNTQRAGLIKSSSRVKDRGYLRKVDRAFEGFK